MPLPLVYNSNYITPLPHGHRFPMPKFKLVRDILLAEGIAAENQFYSVDIASPELLGLVHSSDYIDAFCGGLLEPRAIRRIGLPWSPGLVTRTRTAVSGTLKTARLALKYGLACNTAGGTHHAFPEYGAGFCIFNDLAVAAACLKQERLAGKILIVDLDVHQGDGCAYIFRDDPDIFTFSMHCEANFPFKKQKSDLDVPLPAGLDDAGYMTALQAHFPEVLASVNPDLVLYDAGVDPHVDDRLGRLALSDSGLWQRDELVISRCLANGFPVACVIGGGYDRDVRRLALRHTIVHRVADRLYRQFLL